MKETHKAWRLHAHGDLRLDTLPSSAPDPAGLLVQIEAAMVLSYTDKVVSGAVPYALPPMPFVPGTNAVGRIVATGETVTRFHLGERVFLSPHLRADVAAAAPPQILIGLTAMAGTPDDLALQNRWRDGVFTEVAHWPAACVTPLHDASPNTALQWLGLAKLVVPYGGLNRGGLIGGQTVIINGAAGYFGSGAVMVALARGAGRVVAVGRHAAALDELRDIFGDRVVPAIVNGDLGRDRDTILRAAGGPADLALDLLGRAQSTSTTLSTLRSLKRGGRLVIMGSANAPLEVSFGEMLANDWEIVGQFMYGREAPAELAALVDKGLLNLGHIKAKAFPLADLPAGISWAAGMKGLDLTAVTP